MMNPLVSVVVPTYGRATLLERCIESLLNQDYSPIEIIVVDDNDPGTEDRKTTEQIVRRFTDKPNFTYIQHEQNKNGSAARNTGWRKAGGKYITFVDDDDELHAGKLSAQVDKLESLDQSWVACYTGYEVLKKSGVVQHSSENRSGNCYIFALMRTMFMGSGSNLMIRKDVVDDIGGYDESFRRNQDIEFLVRVLEKGKLAYVDDVLLTIHQDDAGRKHYSFEETEANTKRFLSKYQANIDRLPKKDRVRVISVISLERCRVAFYCGMYKEGISILRDNKVKVSILIKYLFYLSKRVISKKSYGFSG